MAEPLAEGDHRVVFTMAAADTRMAAVGLQTDARPVVLLYADDATRHSGEVAIGTLDLPVPLPDTENGAVGRLRRTPSGAWFVEVAGQVVPLRRLRHRSGGANMLAGQLAASDLVHPRHAGSSSIAEWVTDRAGRGADEGNIDLARFVQAQPHPAVLVAGLVLLLVAGLGWAVFEVVRGGVPPFTLVSVALLAAVLVNRIRESRRRRRARANADTWTNGPEEATRVVLWWSPGATGGVVPWVAAQVRGRLLTWPVVGEGVAGLLDEGYDGVVRGDATADEPWLAVAVGDVVLEPVEPARTLAHVGCTPREVAAISDAASHLAWPEDGTSTAGPG